MAKLARVWLGRGWRARVGALCRRYGEEEEGAQTCASTICIAGDVGSLALGCGALELGAPVHALSKYLTAQWTHITLISSRATKGRGRMCPRSLGRLHSRNMSRQHFFNAFEALEDRTLCQYRRIWRRFLHRGSPMTVELSYIGQFDLRRVIYVWTTDPTFSKHLAATRLPPPGDVGSFKG